jgi:hypothetical protein
MHLFLGTFYGFIGQVISFLALQGSYKYNFLKDNEWIVIASGMPTAFFFYKSVHHFIVAFNGEMWPSRLLGYSIGAIVFYFMSAILFKEALTMKTVVCLILSLVIMLVQIYWKN